MNTQGLLELKIEELVFKKVRKRDVLLVVKVFLNI
jgi:hypothetical protein